MLRRMVANPSSQNRSPSHADIGERLVERGVRRHGRFTQRPTFVNPLDAFGTLTRPLRRLRLKEWVGFTLVHPAWYGSFIIQDAHYLASSEVYAYDRRRRVLQQHARTARGGTLDLPADLLDGRCAFRRPGYELTFDFSREHGRHRLRFDIAATREAKAFRGVLELDARRASPPLSVSSRLPGGAMYTHKAIFPIEGVLRVGEEEIVFDGSRDLAILDEHKSFLPYQTTWLWGTFAMNTDEGLVGANFAERPSIPGEEDESCIWTPRSAEALGELRFEPQSADPLAPWHIHARDGRLDVTFEPEGRKAVRHDFGVVAIDYFQMFGHYRGTLRGADRVHEFDGIHGVCERMDARL